MILDHDGDNWILSDDTLVIRAREIDELDRKLEKELHGELQHEKKIHVYMRTNNDIIPEWMRPYMNHYFNRYLELPLQY